MDTKRGKYILLAIRIHNNNEVNEKLRDDFIPFMLDSGNSLRCLVQGYLSLPRAAPGPVEDRYLLFGSTDKELLEDFLKSVTEKVLLKIAYTFYGYLNISEEDFGGFRRDQVQDVMKSWNKNEKEPWALPIILLGLRCLSIFGVALTAVHGTPFCVPGFVNAPRQTSAGKAWTTNCDQSEAIAHRVHGPDTLYMSAGAEDGATWKPTKSTLSFPPSTGNSSQQVGTSTLSAEKYAARQKGRSRSPVP